MKRGKPLRPGKPLERSGKPLERSGKLQRAGRLRQRSARRVAEEAAKRRLDVDLLALIWRQGAVAPGVCACCGRGPTGSDPLEAHHVLPKQHIKRYVDSLRLPAQQRVELLIELLWDNRNSMALRRSCHALHTNQKRPVPYSCLELRHLQFADALGMLRILDRQYAKE